MVPAQGDQPRLPRPNRIPHAELGKRLSHLPQGQGIIDGRDGNIATVDDGGPVLVRVDAGARVKAAEGGLPARGLPDGAGAEPGSGTVADGCVEGHADDANIEE